MQANAYAHLHPMVLMPVSSPPPSVCCTSLPYTVILRYICEKAEKKDGDDDEKKGCGTTFYNCHERVWSRLSRFAKDMFDIFVVGEVVFHMDVVILFREHIAAKSSIASFRRVIDTLNKTAFFKVSDLHLLLVHPNIMPIHAYLC